MHAFLVLALAYLAMLALYRAVARPTPGTLAQRFGLICRNFASDIGDLDTARPTIAELRTQLIEQGDKIRELRTKPADDRGDTFADDMRQAIDTVHQLDGELKAAERGATPEARGPQAAFEHGGGIPMEMRSPGDQFVNADTYTEARGHNRFGSGYIEAEVRESRALLAEGTTSFTYSAGGDAGVWRPLGTPIPPVPRRQRLFIRDVLNVIQTGMGAIPYIQELNPATTEGGATAVAEGGLKPEVTMTFTPALAPVVKIAAWIPVTEEILEDAPTLAGYINTRLSYMLDLREEAQILKGPGTAPNMEGLRTNTNKQTQTFSSDFPTTIGLAIGKVENVDLEADFVAANPVDFWAAVTTRHATQFDNGMGGAFSTPAVLEGLTWGTVCIRTRSMETGKALVGSSMGATIAERQGTTIKVGNQHSDYFTSNKVVILAERREALLNQRPDAFVECATA